MISICSLVSRLADSWFRTNHNYPSELDYSAPFRPPPCPVLSSSRNTYVVRVSPCDPCTPDSCFYLGFDKPSAIQQRAIKPAIQGRDLIAQSQSGTGKTAVFGISILQTLDTTSNETQARRDVVTGHYHRRRHYHRHRHRHRHYYHRHHHSAPPPQSCALCFHRCCGHRHHRHRHYHPFLLHFTWAGCASSAFRQSCCVMYSAATAHYTAVCCL